MKNLVFTGERLIPKLNKNTAFYYEHLNRYLFANQFVANKTVLDCACGTGYGSFLMSKFGKALSIIGVDISKKSIKYAQHHYNRSNIKFKIDDIKILKSIKSKSIDIISCFETIEHITNSDQAVKQLKRTLKNTGILIISTPNLNNYIEVNKFHLHELSLSDFTELLKRNFKNVEILGQKYFLSQEIFSPTSSENISFNKQKFLSTTDLNYKNETTLESSEYFIAICSDVQIPKTSLQQISINKVDNINLDKGIIPIENKMHELNFIIHSKFYKLWPIYNKIKKLFKFS